MGFYDLPKEDRKKLVDEIKEDIYHDLSGSSTKSILMYSSDDDTYIRKNAYLSIGKLYREFPELRDSILKLLGILFESGNENVRQTVTYALGEIGKIDAYIIFGLLEEAFVDVHHSVRNAVIGALKQMGEKNPKPTLEFAKKFIHHSDPKIRREIIHGIELRGRTHPEEILPLLEELQDDPDKKIRETIIHVLGQISYKKGCLEKVVTSLKKWSNKRLVDKVIEEILDVHIRYEKFSAKSYIEAKEYLVDTLIR